MTGVTGTTGASGTTATYKTTTTAAERNKVDKDLFLTLLVAQMKYQDPSNPMDSTQFLSQTAQFTQVEKLSDLATLTQQQTAGSMIGKTVTYTDDKGAKATGPVTGANLDAKPATVTIGGKSVALDAIITIGEAPTTTETKPAT